eukprot:3891436-Pleurochrysis_carterae.AAC.1
MDSGGWGQMGSEGRPLIRRSIVPSSETVVKPDSQQTSAAAADALSWTHAGKVSSGQQGESGRLIGGKGTLPSDGGSRIQPSNW